MKEMINEMKGTNGANGTMTFKDLPQHGDGSFPTIRMADGRLMRVRQLAHRVDIWAAEGGWTRATPPGTDEAGVMAEVAAALAAGGQWEGADTEVRRHDSDGDFKATDKTDKVERSEVMERTVRMVAVAALEEHPEALNFWPDSEQRAEDVRAVCASVAALGEVRQPLTIAPRAGGGWWVVDGCTRLAGARDAGLERVPCIEVELLEEEIKDEVFMCNMTRTRFSAGMRIVRYLEKHLEAVLREESENAHAAKTGAKGGRGRKAVSRDTAFSSEQVSERLGV